MVKHCYTLTTQEEQEICLEKMHEAHELDHQECCEKDAKQKYEENHNQCY
jgi:hypothetical protein